jgi:hypothetical protein
MLVHRREQHFTEYDFGGRRFRRRIRNWCNYQTPRKGWQASQPTLEQLASEPDDWEGRYDFRRASLAGPAQVFFGGDAVDLPSTGCAMVI